MVSWWHNGYTDNLFALAYVPNPNKKLDILANLASPEWWGRTDVCSDYAHPVLFQLVGTRLGVATRRGAVVQNTRGPYGRFACFNLGLESASGEPVFGILEENRHIYARQDWCLKWFVFREDRRLHRYFGRLPSYVGFDTSSWPCIEPTITFPEITADHIFDERLERVPTRYQKRLQALFMDALYGAWMRVMRDPKVAAFQLYNGRRRGRGFGSIATACGSSTSLYLGCLKSGA